MWETLTSTSALLSFIQEWGDIAIFVIFLLEESGVPLPLPGDLALIWTGYLVATGSSHFVVVLLVVELATLIGASTLYWLGLRGGRPLIVCYGRFLHIEESRLLRVEGWVGRRALLAIFLGRIVPGCRVVTPLVSGVLHVPYRVFLPALAVGTLVNSSFGMGIGFYFGPGIIAALHGPELTAQLLVSVVLLALLVLLTWQIRRTVLPGRRVAAFGAGRGRKIEAAVLAGLVATVEMATAQVIVLAIFTELPISLPERVLLAMVSLSPAGPSDRTHSRPDLHPGRRLLGDRLCAVDRASAPRPGLAEGDGIRVRADVRLMVHRPATPRRRPPGALAGRGPGVGGRRAGP
jgi:membrane-associated protein